MFWIELIALLLLWRILSALQRIARFIGAMKLTVEIPIVDGGGSGQPEQQPKLDGNVIAFREASWDRWCPRMGRST